MKITVDQLDNFYNRYRAKFPNVPDSDHLKKQFALAIDFIEQRFGSDYINCAALGSVNPDTFMEHQTQWDLVCRIFSSSLTAANQYQFDKNQAELISIEVNRQLNHNSLVSMHGVTSNLGIREKFIRGNLSHTEWLTDLDLQRMLELTNTKNKVHIVRFDEKSLGSVLHFEREKNKASSGPYSISLLLNNSSEELQQGVHWISAVITVDPIAHRVTYAITDSLKLTENEKKSYAERILKAIHFEENNAPNLKSFKAFPQREGWSITGTSIGQDQKDGYSCGYRALHNLFQSKSLIGDNALADEYRITKPESSALVKAFQAAQLDNLEIPTQVFEALNHKQRKLFGISNDQNKKQAQRNSVEGFLDSKAAPVGNNAEYLTNPKVSEAVNRLDRFSEVFSFPGVSDSTLTESDYEYLFVLLNQSDIKLKLMQLTPCDTHSLDGLNAYCSLNAGIQFDKLNIDVDASIDPEKFVAKLILTLSNLSENNLAEISFTDKANILKEEHWLYVAEFIKAEGVSLIIDLPAPYDKSFIQQEIDDAVSVNQRIKNTIELSGNKQQFTRLEVTKNEKRSRPRNSARSDLNIDVELQQEIQVEVPVKMQKSHTVAAAKLSFGTIQGLTFSDLEEQLILRKLLLNPGADLITKNELIKSWHTWMGDVVLFEADKQLHDVLQTVPPDSVDLITRRTSFLNMVSREAAEQLLNNRHLFQYGINFDHLPQGFVLVLEPDSNDKILHYDIKSVQSVSAIAPVLNKKTAKKPLKPDLFNDLINGLNPDNPRDKVLIQQWAKLSDDPNYDRMNVVAFRQNISRLLRLNHKVIVQVLQCCGTPFDGDRLNYIMDHYAKVESIFHGNPEISIYNSIAYNSLLNQFGKELSQFIAVASEINLALITNEEPLLISLLANNSSLQKEVRKWSKTLSFKSQQWNALLEVYSEYGEEGIVKLFELWQSIDTILFKELHATVFKAVDSYLPMLNNQQFSLALKTYSGLSQSGDQFKWWTALINQHTAAVGYDDFPSLIDAFNSFVQKITNTEDKGGYGLAFYPEVFFKDVKSLPTALGRMLSILSECSKEDRALQWKCITSIPLQSNGAIRAITDGVRTHTRCGFVVPEMLTTPVLYDDIRGYNTAGEWKDISKYANLKQTREHFYRYIAHQKDRLSLSFYQEMDKKITETRFSEKEKIQLYAILADCSTGENNHKLPLDFEKSRNNWESIMTRLGTIKIPIPLATDRVRANIIGKLFLLGHTPPLPTLNRLVTLIIDATKKGITQLNANAERLTKACAQLNQISKQWGDAIYVGMHFYDDTSYSQTGESIFYRHLATASALLQGRDENELNHENGKRLISVISHFGIANQNEAENTQEAFKVRELYDTARAWSSQVNNALDLLLDIEKRTPPELTPIQLMTFFSELSVVHHINTEKMQDLVKSHFGDYFPVGYFERLQAKKVPYGVEKLLVDHFDAEEIKLIKDKILGAFIDPDDRLKYFISVSKLINLTRDMVHDERIFILNKLGSQDLLNKTSIADFNDLLDVINKTGSPDDFLFFLSKAADFKFSPVDGLLKKAHLYLNTLFPAIDKLKSADVSRMETQKLLIDLLLANAPDKLGSSPGIIRDDELDYQQMLTALSSDISEVNPKQLASAMDTFLGKTRGGEELLSALFILKKHLDALNQPEPIPTKIADSVKPTVETKKNITEKLVGNVKTGFNRLVSYLGLGSKEEVPVLQEEVHQPIVVAIQKPKVIDPDLLLKAKDELSVAIEQRKRFDSLFIDLIHAINLTAEHYSGDKITILNYLKYFLVRKPETEDQLVYSWRVIHLLKNEFITLNDPDLVRSLCAHFNNKAESTPESLVALFNNPDYALSTNDNKKLFLNILTSLINNAKPCSVEALTDLMHRCKEVPAGPVLLEQLKLMYQFAPYPTLTQVDDWIKEGQLEARYSAFDIEPVPRLNTNGFDRKAASDQAAKMVGVTYTAAELDSIAKEASGVRLLSTKEIQSQLKALREKQLEMNSDKIVALAAELLYRTCSLGINTTQYLALHSMLKTGRHVTSEIGTGEGKSRIMMLGVACQYLLGQTVDFVTADVQLATRDYLSFKALFQTLGAQTNLIYQNTPATGYKLDGINFSDAASLSLFRNKARSEGLGHLVINKEPNNRALMLDEADQVYFDLDNTRFNYSALADESIREMEWVYDVLVSFFSQSDSKVMGSYYSDVDACTKKFMDYTTTKVPSKISLEQLARLKSISKAQLEVWQQSAVTALSLKFNEDFVLSTNIDIETAKGPKTVHEARLLVGNTESRGSKFSFGVHQCLHARLNRLLSGAQQANESERELAKRLQAADCKNHQFFIDDEKQIIYSSTSKSILDEYSLGTLYAVTGTAGSIQEQEEAKSLYREDVAASDMAFLSVPRHKGLNRTDFPLYLASDKKEQNELIFDQIKQARASNQPILVLCENDSDTKAMMTYLEKKFPNDAQLRRIDAQTSFEEEKKHIKDHAGTSGMITVATNRVARGRDIALHGDAAMVKGLKVLVAYLPRDRQLKQMIARAGRFGAKGDSRVIVNKKQLKKQLGKATLTDGFYTASEAYIKQQLARMDREAQVKRLIKFTANDFRIKITINYFNDFFSQVDSQEQRGLNRLFTIFFDETDKKWNETWIEINGHIETHIPPDVSEINRMLGIYKDVVQSKWDDLISKVQLISLKGTVPGSDPKEKLKSDVGSLQLTPAIEGILKHSTTAVLKTPVYDKYDPAHDGKAVLYTAPMEKWAAFFRGERRLFADFRAWKRGSGILFPNLRAWWNGHMTFGQLLSGVGYILRENTKTEVVRSDATEHAEDNSYNKMTHDLKAGVHKTMSSAAVSPHQEPRKKQKEDFTNPSEQPGVKNKA